MLVLWATPQTKHISKLACKLIDGEHGNMGDIFLSLQAFGGGGVKGSTTLLISDGAHGLPMLDNPTKRIMS